MSILNQLASALNRRDEVPNQELAARISADDDTGAVRELVDNLANRSKAIRHDCIKVLYEIGSNKPELIADYSDAFVGLLTTKDNRMVWGGMTALGSIAPLKPHDIWQHIDTILKTTETGSVITQDWGIRVLAIVAAVKEQHSARIFPFLIDFLKQCRPKDVARHAESVVVAANTSTTRRQLKSVLENRLSHLKSSPRKRVERVLRQLDES